MVEPTPLRAALACVLLATACNKDPQQDPAPLPFVAPVPAPAPVAAAPALPAPSKLDAVNPERLQAGLGLMLPRVAGQVDGLSKIAPNGHFRFFIHPPEKGAASLELDTKGLAALVLSPFMEDFSSDVNCTPNDKAGIAQLTWSVDGKKKGSLLVDRNYAGLVPVDLKGSSRLKLEVDAGNGVIWCDWMTVGMVNVTEEPPPPAPPASGAPAPSAGTP